MEENLLDQSRFLIDLAIDMLHRLNAQHYSALDRVPRATWASPSNVIEKTRPDSRFVPISSLFLWTKDSPVVIGCLFDSPLPAVTLHQANTEWVAGRLIVSSSSVLQLVYVYLLLLVILLAYPFCRLLVLSAFIVGPDREFFTEMAEKAVSSFRIRNDLRRSLYLILTNFDFLVL